MTPEEIRVVDIRLDGGTQSRAALDSAWVDELAAVVKDGERALDPVVVFHDGSDYWLADGFHRVAACARAGRAIIRAEVRQGTRRDAVLFACGANATHGLRRTNADKRRAVETLLRDEEWSGWSNQEIARRCGVSPSTVATVRSELTQKVGESTTPQSRKGADGRTINTANIGRKPAEAPPAPAPPVEAPAAPVRPVVAPPAPEPDEDYSALDDVEPELVHVEPEPFATPVEPERTAVPLAVERMAADLASAIRDAHALVSAALARVPERDREAVIARIDRPIHLLLDVVEQLAPASAPKGWRPTVIAGGRS